jgi:hypothetical protein
VEIFVSLMKIEYPVFKVYDLLREHNLSFALCGHGDEIQRKGGSDCSCSPGHVVRDSRCVDEALIPVSRKAKYMKSK